MKEYFRILPRLRKSPSDWCDVVHFERQSNVKLLTPLSTQQAALSMGNRLRRNLLLKYFSLLNWMASVRLVFRFHATNDSNLKNKILHFDTSETFFYRIGYLYRVLVIAIVVVVFVDVVVQIKYLFRQLPFAGRESVCQCCDTETSRSTNETTRQNKTQW